VSPSPAKKKGPPVELRDPQGECIARGGSVQGKACLLFLAHAFRMFRVSKLCFKKRRHKKIGPNTMKNAVGQQAMRILSLRVLTLQVFHVSSNASTGKLYI
jgi:hypothetical protein